MCANVENNKEEIIPTIEDAGEGSFFLYSRRRVERENIEYRMLREAERIIGYVKFRLRGLPFSIVYIPMTDRLRIVIDIIRVKNLKVDEEEEKGEQK